MQSFLTRCKRNPHDVALFGLCQIGIILVAKRIINEINLITEQNSAGNLLRFEWLLLIGRFLESLKKSFDFKVFKIIFILYHSQYFIIAMEIGIIWYYWSWDYIHRWKYKTWMGIMLVMWVPSSEQSLSLSRVQGMCAPSWSSLQFCCKLCWFYQCKVLLYLSYLVDYW